jgi:pyruvate formate-lyase activating enzyme-like uncharacterized protein
MKKKNRNIKNTGHFSKCTGEISKGCRLCVKGRKLVVFVTGVCSRNCYYCPLSEEKKNKDVIFANERPVNSKSDIISEAEISGSTGASITGGDPLAVLDRTCAYIKLLKKKYGKNFHIHLYAPLELVSEKSLKRLCEAGLDEIRFHPDLSSDKNWGRLSLALMFPWDIGLEIPVIPGTEKESKKLLAFAAGKVSFVNLNELEISDTNAGSFLSRKFKPKDRISYGVLGSEALAVKLMKFAGAMPYAAHYCTAKLKDAVQLANRIKLRAEKSSEDFDIVTKEGLLLRGAVYLPALKPSFSYKEKIKKITEAKRKIILKTLEKAREQIISECSIPKNMIKLDYGKLRLITALPIAEALSPELRKRGLIPASVLQYPTFDQMEIELSFL